MSQINVISDLSYHSLAKVPDYILDMCNLKMLYLDGNFLTELPPNIFQKLPKLYWLDLRGNKLKELPKGIGNHKYLENLLLQNNDIEKLPDELGLVPNLKVLQLSGNPLEYPPSNIIERGVDDICIFLKQEYYRKNVPDSPPAKSPPTTPKKSNRQSSRPSSANTPSTKTSVKEVRKEISNEDVQPLVIKRLSKKRSPRKEKLCSKLNPPVHELYKSSSKVSIRSYYSNSEKYVGIRPEKPQELRIGERELKDIWLSQLKEIITDQHKIIQQERNLDALSNWRLKQKMELPKEVNYKTVAPFDTNAEYNALMSRFDLSKNIEKLISIKRLSSHTNSDVDSLIKEVVSKLKGMETKLQEDATPAEKLRRAEEEIQNIVSLHKKITEIKVANDTF